MTELLYSTTSLLSTHWPSSPDVASIRTESLAFPAFVELLEQLREKVGLQSADEKPIVGNDANEGFERCVHLLESLSTGIDELRMRLVRSEAMNHEQRLQIQARSEESHTDALTGLPNRRFFDEQFEERCAAAQHSQCPLVLAILDIDHFKSINDSRGHHVGDAVLRSLARFVSSLLPPGVALTRYGGEEFTMLLSGTSLDLVIELVERIRHQIKLTHFQYEGRSIALTVSCGLASLAPDEHREQLLYRADLALYAAKQGGRNNTCWHDGTQFHRATLQEPLPASSDTPPQAIELREPCQPPATYESSHRIVPSMSHTARVNWCDSGTFFWYLRQRILERKRGGESFCVLALDVDHSQRIHKSFGPVALHFMIRTQSLHLDAVFRDTDVIARTCSSKVLAVLPRTQLMETGPLLHRLHDTMERFVYPTIHGLVDYSLSLGITEVSPLDDPAAIVQRAESALTAAQSRGVKQFFATDGTHSWNLFDASAAPGRLASESDFSDG